MATNWNTTFVLGVVVTMSGYKGQIEWGGNTSLGWQSVQQTCPHVHKTREAAVKCARDTLRNNHRVHREAVGA